MIYHNPHNHTEIRSSISSIGDISAAPSLTAIDGTGVKAAITKDQRSLGLSTAMLKSPAQFQTAKRNWG